MQEAINVGLAALREKPCWPLVYDADGRPPRGVDARWEPLASEVPPRLPRDGETGCPLVSLFPPVGFERDWAVDDLVRPDSEAARLLGDRLTAGFGARTCPACAARSALLVRSAFASREDAAAFIGGCFGAGVAAGPRRAPRSTFATGAIAAVPAFAKARAFPTPVDMGGEV